MIQFIIYFSSPFSLSNVVILEIIMLNAPSAQLLVAIIALEYKLNFPFCFSYLILTRS